MSGHRTATDWARHHHGILAGQSQKAPLSDPGAALTFDDSVSMRGALTLHALRTEIGEESFFGIMRSWVTANRGGSVTTESFVTHCSRELGRDLSAWFTPWLDETPLPRCPDGAQVSWRLPRIRT